MALKKTHFVSGGQVAVVWDAFVEIVGHEVEDILLEVGPGAADGMDLVLPDHFSKGKAEFRSAHGSGKSQEHGAAPIKVRGVGTGGVLQCGGVEVAVVMFDELGNGS